MCSQDVLTTLVVAILASCFLLDSKFQRCEALLKSAEACGALRVPHASARYKDSAPSGSRMDKEARADFFMAELERKQKCQD